MTIRRRWLLTLLAFVLLTSVLEIGVGSFLNMRFGSRRGADLWLSEMGAKALPAHHASVYTSLDMLSRALLTDPQIERALAAESADAAAVAAALAARWTVLPGYAWIVAAGTDDAAPKSSAVECEGGAARLAAVDGPSIARCGDAGFIGTTTTSAHGARFFLGRRVDDAYAWELSLLTGAEVDLRWEDGQELATTLRGPDGKSAVPIVRRELGFAAVEATLAEPYRGLPIKRPDVPWAMAGETTFSWFVYASPLELTAPQAIDVTIAVPSAVMTQGVVYGALTTTALALLVLGGALFVGSRLVRRFTRPLENIARAVDRVAHSPEPVEVAVDGGAEVASLACSFNTMVHELQLTRRRAIQAEKMSAIGGLASGIAHEINTPTQYAGDSTEFVALAVDQLVAALRTCEPAVKEPTEANRAAALVTVERLQLDLLAADVADAVGAARDGLGRIGRIVSAMKSFGHPGSGDLTSVDLRELCDVTATVARGEWKDTAQLDIDIADDVGAVWMRRDELGQTLLNLIVNAADAIRERYADSDILGHIRIGARRRGAVVEIRVSDDGCGIPPEVRTRIFEPFFTTKEVGKGTGQGLAIAWSAVVDKHGGTIEVESAAGAGTTFVITLPDGPGRALARAA